MLGKQLAPLFTSRIAVILTKSLKCLRVRMGTHFSQVPRWGLGIRAGPGAGWARSSQPPAPDQGWRGGLSSGRRRAEGCTARSAREAAAPARAAAAQPGRPARLAQGLPSLLGRSPPSLLPKLAAGPLPSWAAAPAPSRPSRWQLAALAVSAPAPRGSRIPPVSAAVWVGREGRALSKGPATAPDFCISARRHWGLPGRRARRGRCARPGDPGHLPPLGFLHLWPGAASAARPAPSRICACDRSACVCVCIYVWPGARVCARAGGTVHAGSAGECVCVCACGCECLVRSR